MSIRIGAYVRIRETGEIGEVTSRFDYRDGHKEYGVEFDKPNALGDRGYRCPESSLTVVPKPKKSVKGA